MSAPRPGQCPFLAAVADLLGEVTDGFCDNAERFTCTETDALATVLRLVAAPETAVHLLHRHAAGDEEGDLHVAVGTAEDARTYLANLTTDPKTPPADDDTCPSHHAQGQAAGDGPRGRRRGVLRGAREPSQAARIRDSVPSTHRT